MYNFKGISPDTLMLLEMNRFNNNKPFYEEHKKEINEGARKQMGALTLDLSDSLYDIDENILVNPKKVSRIRRDTRFTKDKTLYRANVWTIWHRPIAEGETAPGMWAEVSPQAVSWGVGLWGTKPAFMQFFRQSLLEDYKPFVEVFLPLVEAGYSYLGNRYKRDREGTDKLPEVLKEIYNQKELYFMGASADLSLIADSSFVDFMKEQLQLIKPMYLYLDKLNKNYCALEK